MRAFGVFFLFMIVFSARLLAQVESSSASSQKDSIRNVALLKPPSDTVSVTFPQWKFKIDSTRHGLSRKIDSLHEIHLDASVYRHKLDSLNNIDPLKTFEEKKASLASYAPDKIKAITKTTETVDKVSKYPTKKIADYTPAILSLPPSALDNMPRVKIPEPGILNEKNLTMPDISLPKVKGPLSTSVLPNLSKKILPDDVNLNQLKNLPNVDKLSLEKAGGAAIAEQASGIEHLAGDLKNEEALEKKITNEAKNNLEGAAEIAKQTGEVEKYKNLSDDLANPEALQKLALEEGKKQALNHFAGKEDVIKGAIAYVSTLKAKYPNLNGLENIPKRVPNALHGKPFLNRLVPALTFQMLKLQHNYRVDVFPAIGYKFNPKLTVGAGWSMRLVTHHGNLHRRHDIYGPRSYADYKFNKGYSLRAELETMRSRIPPGIASTITDPHSRKWIWNSFVGLKKDYALSKWLKGNAQVLYNVNGLFDKHHINLYGDPLIARVGFEFIFNSKRRKN